MPSVTTEQRFLYYLAIAHIPVEHSQLAKFCKNQVNQTHGPTLEKFPPSYFTIALSTCQ
jgi:hypothetical protein